MIRSIICDSLSKDFCIVKHVSTVATANTASSYSNVEPKFRKNKQQNPKSNSGLRLYRNLFPWRNELQLADYLSKNVVYNKNGLIAINKPWGLGIHKAFINQSRNQSIEEQMLNSQIFGECHFCVADVLDYLSQLLNLENRLHIVKSLDRKWSGLLLLSTDPKIQTMLDKSLGRAKSFKIPNMKFHCIVNGIIPNIELGKSYFERCGIRLTEIDELGKFKEPIYVSPNEMTNNMRKHATQKDRMPLGPVKPATVQYRMLAKNSDLAVSLIELQTTATKWSLIQCFLAYKASFVLGDTFFSHRVKHIFGQPITMASLKQKRLENWRHLDQNFEPLSTAVRQALSVRSNREIPLMIHHNGLIFPRLLKSLTKSKTKNQQQPEQTSSELSNISTSFDHELINQNEDLIIEIDSYPEHFKQTLKRLNLLNE